MSETKKKEIIIPEFFTKEIRIKIEGTTPLLTHRFDPKNLEVSPTKKRVIPSEEEKFQSGLYVIREGVYGFPAAGVKKAMVSAGYRFGDAASTVLKGALNVLADMIEIIGPPPIPRTDPCKVGGRNKVASLTTRPQFFPWSMWIPIAFSPETLSVEQVVNLVRLAGFAVGIGDWRPERSGTMGQFIVKEIQAND